MWECRDFLFLRFLRDNIYIQGASGIDACFLKQIYTSIKYLKITTA
jgi:hypothetical protein